MEKKITSLTQYAVFILLGVCNYITFIRLKNHREEPEEEGEREDMQFALINLMFKLVFTSMCVGCQH